MSGPVTQQGGSPRFGRLPVIGFVRVLFGLQGSLIFAGRAGEYRSLVAADSGKGSNA